MKPAAPASRPPPAALDAALAHHQAGRLDLALEHYRALRPGAARDARVWHLGGVALLQLGRPGEAVEWLRGAVKLSPSAAPSWLCLGSALLRENRADEAVPALRRAVELAPANGEAWTNLGLALHRLGSRDEALTALRRGAEARPTDPTGWTAWGQALLSAGRAGEALAALARAPAAKGPAGAALHSARAAALHALGRMAEAAAEFDRALALDPANLAAASQRLLVLHYLDDISAEQIFAEHRAFGRTLRARLGPAVLPTRAGPRREGRLRVGFFSPDFRDHAVACFFAPLLAGLRDEGLEVFLYHNHPVEDAVSARLRSLAANWKNLAPLGDDAALAAIRADAPDVLFDLAGHTGSARPALFARRAAPVQISYLGYPNGTGLDTMDFRFTDAVADPEGGADALHVEKLVRFSPCAWCYEPPLALPAPEPPPASLDASRPVAFGSFNHLGKLSPATWQLWARVLDATPGATLTLKGSEPSPGWLNEHARAAGIDPARVRLLPFAPERAAHFAAYGQLDIALDPLPYHGTTSTCEALWMGRPVVTLAGDRHVRRVGASLLRAVGAEDCVAATEDDYVAIAARLAADRAGLARRAAALRAAAQSSPLGDAAAQARAFAAAIRACVTP